MLIDDKGKESMRNKQQSDAIQVVVIFFIFIRTKIDD